MHLLPFFIFYVMTMFMLLLIIKQCYDNCFPKNRWRWVLSTISLLMCISKPIFSLSVTNLAAQFSSTSFAKLLQFDLVAGHCHLVNGIFQNLTLLFKIAISPSNSCAISSSCNSLFWPPESLCNCIPWSKFSRDSITALFIGLYWYASFVCWGNVTLHQLV